MAARCLGLQKSASAVAGSCCTCIAFSSHGCATAMLSAQATLGLNRIAQILSAWTSASARFHVGGRVV